MNCEEKHGTTGEGGMHVYKKEGVNEERHRGDLGGPLTKKTCLAVDLQGEIFGYAKVNYARGKENLMRGEGKTQGLWGRQGFSPLKERRDIKKKS